MTRIKEQMLSVQVIAGELIAIASRHKKKTCAVSIFEVWAHGLAMQHLGELKSLWQIIPFLH